MLRLYQDAYTRRLPDSSQKKFFTLNVSGEYSQNLPFSSRHGYMEKSHPSGDNSEIIPVS